MEFQEAVRHIKEQGYRLTPQRAEILRALIEAGTALSAQAVLARVQQTYSCVSLDTVYRNLAMLTETGLVNQVNLQNKGIARFEFQGQSHHHHAICLQCGRSFCVDDCPLPTPLPMPAEDPRFQVVRHAYEIYGYCSGCQATAMP